MEWEGAHDLGGRVYRSAPPSEHVRQQLLDDGVTVIELPDEGKRGPAYYGEVLRRSPGHITSVFAQIADAPPGDVLVYGDRTGMIVAMLLSLVGTPVADILDDYELAVRTMNAYYEEHPDAGESPLTGAALEEHCADACLAMVAFLGSTDVAGYLTNSGLTFEQLDRLRARLTN